MKYGLLFYSLFLFFYLDRAQALQVTCYEDELSSSARIIFLASTENSPKVITLEQSFATPHPTEGLGYIFQKIKQSESSGSRFPLGVYTGTTLVIKNDKEELYRGTLVIEEQGEWTFSGFKYQYRGTYMLHGPHDLATGIDRSQLLPVSCRAKGFINSGS